MDAAQPSAQTDSAKSSVVEEVVEGAVGEFESLLG